MLTLLNSQLRTDSMSNLLQKITNRLLRGSINAKNRARLTNTVPSVLSSNCNGAFILHDLGLKFNSPFVNLYMTPADFIRYLQNFEYYRQAELHFTPSDKSYPIGKLDDLTVHFMHYRTEAEACFKWVERTARIDTDNLFVMMTDRDGCTYQDLQAFEALPLKNKVVFTHRPYPELASSFYIKGFEEQGQVGDLYEFSGWYGKKYYDQFDYVGWFNGDRI